MSEIKFLQVGLIFLLCDGHIGCQNQDVVRLTPNVALKGEAAQSRDHISSSFTASPFVAGYAIDGSFETSVSGGRGACAITDPAPPVWWQVDLHEVYEITKVAITGRKEDNKLKDFYIVVGNNSDGSSAEEITFEPKALAPSETRVYTFPCGIFGRYVRIRYRVNRNAHLQLCEVQVQAGGFYPEPVKMDNAVRSVPNTQYDEGTNITYTCDQCYTGGGTSTCQCNREWTPVPDCSIDRCADPGTIENGQVEGSAPFTCVSTLKYTCNDGYWLLGAETLRCGIDGQWDHGKPLCIDKSQGCGEPQRIDHAQRFGSVSEVTYECIECYTGGGRATCTDGEWTHDGGRCEMVPCDNIPDVSYGKRSPAEDSVACGTKVRYTCNEGLVLNGDSVLRCEAGGELLGKVPVCKGPGHTATGDIEMNENGTEKNNDELALGLTAVGTLLGGILMTLAAVLLCKRKGIDPCPRIKPRQDQTNHDYEQPNPSPQIAKTNDDTNDQYMELDDPNFAGYKNHISN